MQQTKILLSIDEAADQLSVSRSHLYSMIARGELRSIKMGKSRRIPSDEIQAYVHRRLETDNPNAA